MFSPIAGNNNRRLDNFASPIGQGIMLTPVGARWSRNANFLPSPVGQGLTITPISAQSRRYANALPLPLTRIDQNVDEEPNDKSTNSRRPVSTAKKEQNAKLLFHDAIFRGIYMSPDAFVLHDTPSSVSLSKNESLYSYLSIFFKM
jgi:hypothetical protein